MFAEGDLHGLEASIMEGEGRLSDEVFDGLQDDLALRRQRCDASGDRDPRDVVAPSSIWHVHRPTHRRGISSRGNSLACRIAEHPRRFAP